VGDREWLGGNCEGGSVDFFGEAHGAGEEFEVQMIVVMGTSHANMGCTHNPMMNFFIFPLAASWRRNIGIDPVRIFQSSPITISHHSNRFTSVPSQN